MATEAEVKRMLIEICEGVGTLHDEIDLLHNRDVEYCVESSVNIQPVELIRTSKRVPQLFNSNSVTVDWSTSTVDYVSPEGVPLKRDIYKIYQLEMVENHIISILMKPGMLSPSMFVYLLQLNMLNSKLLTMNSRQKEIFYNSDVFWQGKSVSSSIDVVPCKGITHLYSPFRVVMFGSLNVVVTGKHVYCKLQEYRKSLPLGFCVSRWACFRSKISSRINYDVEDNLLKIYFPVMNSALLIVLSDENGPVITVDDCAVVIISWLESNFMMIDEVLYRREKSLDIEIVKCFVNQSILFHHCKKVSIYHKRGYLVSFNGVLWDRFFFPQYFRDFRQIVIPTTTGSLVVRIPSLMIDTCPLSHYNRKIDYGVLMKVKVCLHENKLKNVTEFFTIFTSQVDPRNMFEPLRACDRVVQRYPRKDDDYIFYWNLVFFTSDMMNIVCPSFIVIEVRLENYLHLLKGCILSISPEYGNVDIFYE